MAWIATVLVGVVVLLHAGFLVLEMFLWSHPIGRQIFQVDREFAEASRALAANQGLYNGFLVAGLVWGMVDQRVEVEVFFLACVIAAGGFGAATVSPRILWVQAAPAAVALVAVLATR